MNSCPVIPHPTLPFVLLTRSLRRVLPKRNGSLAVPSVLMVALRAGGAACTTLPSHHSGIRPVLIGGLTALSEGADVLLKEQQLPLGLERLVLGGV